MNVPHAETAPGEREPELKCVVWDLDQTLWPGVLLEGTARAVTEPTRRILELLDSRGVIQSVASRNEEASALAFLRSNQIRDYFVYPQIGWSAKSEAVSELVRLLAIDPGTVLFVDDSPFERAEVESVLPAVRTADPSRLDDVLSTHGVLPAHVSETARQRRQLYVSEERRRTEERDFDGTKAEFMKSLQMCLTIRDATAEDLDRAEELTRRTHQLNTTGVTYSREQLTAMLDDPAQRLLIATLTDRFGSYDRIGLAALELAGPACVIRLLLMSCRVINRNIGTAMLAFIARFAASRGLTLEAELRSTDRNRPMYLTYRLQGFVKSGTRGGTDVYTLPTAATLRYPEYIQLQEYARE